LDKARVLAVSIEPASIPAWAFLHGPPLVIPAPGAPVWLKCPVDMHARRSESLDVQRLCVLAVDPIVDTA
jgi:hypothetical protein